MFKRNSKQQTWSARKSIILFFHTYLAGESVKRSFRRKDNKKSIRTYIQAVGRNILRMKKGLSKKRVGRYVEKHKHDTIQAFDGKTTVIKRGGDPVIVPEKRSDRPEKYQNTGRYAHKPWPFKRKNEA